MGTILSLDKKTLTTGGGGLSLAEGATGAHSEFASSLEKDWLSKIELLGEVSRSTARLYAGPVRALLGFTGKSPWSLTKLDISRYLEFRARVNGKPLSETTVATYASAWRSFQSFLSIPEISNEIALKTGVRPEIFIDDANGIAVRRVKSNQVPKHTALTVEQIADAEAEWLRMINLAQAQKSKALFPLLRDRVMFHLAIHYALRVSELVTLQLHQFSAHSSPEMRELYGDYGVLTVTGKGKVTGSIPMRDPSILKMLSIYLQRVRPEMLRRAKAASNWKERVTYDNKEYAVENLLFLSERGGVVGPHTFRKRLAALGDAIGLPYKLCPHSLRHTGCTLMVPLYTPETAKGYMRHRGLATTLHYYHPDPLNAGAHHNPHYEVGMWFDDE